MVQGMLNDPPARDLESYQALTLAFQPMTLICWLESSFEVGLDQSANPLDQIRIARCGGGDPCGKEDSEERSASFISRATTRPSKHGSARYYTYKTC